MNNFNKYKNKLLLLLHSFDRYELNKLQKFIESPYFNKSEIIISLFQLLKKDIIKGQTKTKEFYYKKLFNNDKFDDQKFRNILSDILKLVQQFLTQEEFENDFQAQAIYLIDAVKKKQLKPFYDKAISSANKLMIKNKYKNSEFFLRNYELQNSLYKLSSEFEKKSKMSKRKENIDILQINDYLDYYYMMEKLKYYTFYLSWKTITNVNYEFPYIDKVLAIVKTYRKILPPALQIYYNIYKISIDNTDVNAYYNLKKLIKEHISIFDPYEQNTVYSSLINFIVKQVNKGSTEFLEEYLDVSISGIESKAILEDGMLSASKFRNIVLSSLRLKRYEWTKNFIDENIELIQSDQRENALKYNMSRYYFYKKDYPKLIETLREVEFDDALYALISKSMLLVSYYEQFEEEALLNFAETFNAYIRRTGGLTDKIRNDYKKLIKFVKILNKARFQPDLLPKLKRDILDTKALPSKQWFLEKLEHIKLDNE